MGEKLDRCVKRVKKKDSKVNPWAVCKSAIRKSFERELKIGTRIEKKEHGFSLAISRKIALDHIREHPKYYTDKKYGLIAIEKKMKKRKG